MYYFLVPRSSGTHAGYILMGKHPNGLQTGNLVEMKHFHLHKAMFRSFFTRKAYFCNRETHYMSTSQALLHVSLYVGFWIGLLF